MRNFTEHPITAEEATFILRSWAEYSTWKNKDHIGDPTALVLKVVADYIEADTKRFEDFARDDI